jgi:large subunit ribosomal protein L6
MSRIGRLPVPIPSGVNVAMSAGAVQVKGPLGELSWSYPAGLKVDYDESAKEIRVARPNDERRFRALHGLARSLINNMIVGVSQGFEKRLEIQGLGYQARLQGERLELVVGFAKPVQKKVPEGLTIEVPDATHIVVRGADKQRVGQFAAEIRAVRPPEPYKGKGIRYAGEQIRRKAGKAFASGG